MFILCLSYISRSGIKSFVLVSQRFGYVRVFSLMAHKMASFVSNFVHSIASIRLLEILQNSYSNISFFTLQVLSTCFICLEEDWNLPEAECCKKHRHNKCKRRWRRTLVANSNRCAHCRADFPRGWTAEYMEEVNQFMVERRRMVSILTHYVLYLYKPA